MQSIQSLPIPFDYVFQKEEEQCNKQPCCTEVDKEETNNQSSKNKTDKNAQKKSKINKVNRVENKGEIVEQEEFYNREGNIINTCDEMDMLVYNARIQDHKRNKHEQNFMFCLWISKDINQEEKNKLLAEKRGPNESFNAKL